MTDLRSFLKRSKKINHETVGILFFFKAVVKQPIIYVAKFSQHYGSSVPVVVATRSEFCVLHRTTHFRVTLSWFVTYCSQMLRSSSEPPRAAVFTRLLLPHSDHRGFSQSVRFLCHCCDSFRRIVAFCFFCSENVGDPRRVLPFW